MSRGLEKRYIPKTNHSVSFLGFGALEIGRDWGIGDQDKRRCPSEKTAGVVLDAVLDAGINLIDTASAYHKSEERIGKFISHRRKEYILSTKCGEHNNEPGTYYDFSYGAIRESIDNSLRLLNTDFIDIMFIHFSRDYYESMKVIDKGETLQALNDTRKEGKVRLLGASANGDLARKCILSGDFEVMQMDYNLLDRENEENIELCRERGIGVFARTGLAKGLLTSKAADMMGADFPQKEKMKKLLRLTGNDYNRLTRLAFHFLYQTKGITSVLVGTKDPLRIGLNMRIIDSEIEQELIEKAMNI